MAHSHPGENSISSPCHMASVPPWGYEDLLSFFQFLNWLDFIILSLATSRFTKG